MYPLSVKIRRTIAHMLVAVFCFNSFSVPLSAVVSYPQLDMEMHVGPEYITITTQALEGLNLKMVISEIVKQAQELGIIDELPAGMLHCYKMIQDGHDAVHYKDLNEALPLIIEKLLPSMVVDADGNVVEKAIRPTDGVAGCAPIVGAVGCDLIPVLNLLAKIKALIIIDFAATWTILADLKDTLTTCCENIQNDFEATWTILADIKDTLTTCCENIQNDFESTWTVLADLKDTVTVDFAGVFTALDACCENITEEFQETWTVLADIKATLTTCCQDIQNDFAGTWTLIEACCEELSNQLDQIELDISVLQETVETDFAGVFTALDGCCQDLSEQIAACCDQITQDFQGTWTILANLEVEVDVDFDGVYTSIADVKETIEACCDDIQQNFDGMFTALEGCCESLNEQLDSVVNILIDLEDIVTACCDNISNDLVGVYTAINAVNVAVEECCENITSEFEQTWTILDRLEEIVQDLGSTCDVSTRITAPITISQPGHYCLANDIVGTVTIAASCVELDLNGFTITSTVDGAVFIDSVSDVRVTNGKITGLSGVLVLGGQTVALDNLVIFDLEGGLGLVGVSGVTIDNLVFKGNSLALVATTVTNMKVRSTQFYDNVGTVDDSLIEITTSSNILFEQCCVNNNTLQGTAFPVYVNLAGDNIQFSGCTFNNNTGEADFAAVRVEGALVRNVVFTNCEFNENSSSGTQCAGLWFDGANSCTAKNCTANGNSNGTFAVGYLLNNGSRGCSIIDSSANDNTGGSGYGLYIDSTTNCSILRNSFINNDNGIFKVLPLVQPVAILGNYADSGGLLTNYNALLAPVVVYTKSLGVFAPPPVLFDNISAV